MLYFPLGNPGSCFIIPRFSNSQSDVDPMPPRILHAVAASQTSGSTWVTAGVCWGEGCEGDGLAARQTSITLSDFPNNTKRSFPVTRSSMTWVVRLVAFGSGAVEEGCGMTFWLVLPESKGWAIGFPQLLSRVSMQGAVISMQSCLKSFGFLKNWRLKMVMDFAYLVDVYRLCPCFEHHPTSRLCSSAGNEYRPTSTGQIPLANHATDNLVE